MATPKKFPTDCINHNAATGQCKLLESRHTYHFPGMGEFIVGEDFFMDGLARHTGIMGENMHKWFFDMRVPRAPPARIDGWPLKMEMLRSCAECVATVQGRLSLGVVKWMFDEGICAKAKSYVCPLIDRFGTPRIVVWSLGVGLHDLSAYPVDGGFLSENCEILTCAP